MGSPSIVLWHLNLNERKENEMPRIDFESPRWMYQDRQQHFSHIEQRVLSLGFVVYVMGRADALPDGKFDYELADQLADMIWDDESYSDEDFERSKYSYAMDSFDGKNVAECIRMLNDFDRRKIQGIANHIVTSYDHMKGIK